MRTNRKFSYFFVMIAVFIAVILSCNVSGAGAKEKVPAGKSGKINKVILFIGDGMGAEQRRIAAIVEGNGDRKHRLFMEKMSASGTATNFSLNSPVTDSAAAGTALATGHKTNNKMISVDSKGNHLKTILEFCLEKKLATGLVSTVMIYDATPSAFASHAKSRKDYETIVLQYLERGVDVISGGGWDNFIPENSRFLPGGKRTDGKDVISDFKKAGYKFVSDRNSLLGIDYSKTGKLLGLFSTGAMPYEIDRNAAKCPSISDMTVSALKILDKNPNGFFLMVEGGRMDWACHGHDLAAALHDTIALDKAVKIGLDYAKKNPSTLVIVVNDHETGGFAISNKVDVNFIKSQKSSAESIARRIKKDGSNIDEVMLKYAGIKKLDEAERKIILDEANGRVSAKDEWGYGGTVISNIICKRAGVSYSTGGHTATPVVLAAEGPGSAIFNGKYDQTDIPKKIAKLMGIEMK